jgi:hypothetical protein
MCTKLGLGIKGHTNIDLYPSWRQDAKIRINGEWVDCELKGKVDSKWSDIEINKL